MLLLRDESGSWSCDMGAGEPIGQRLPQGMARAAADHHADMALRQRQLAPHAGGARIVPAASATSATTSATSAAARPVSARARTAESQRQSPLRPKLTQPYALLTEIRRLRSLTNEFNAMVFAERRGHPWTIRTLRTRRTLFWWRRVVDQP